MFKKFRIKHEGLHRIGIIIGIFSIIFIPWLVLGADNNYRDNMFVYFFLLLEEAIDEGGYVYLIIIAYYIFSYSLGYFIFKFLIWLTTWLKEGFKK